MNINLTLCPNHAREVQKIKGQIKQIESAYLSFLDVIIDKYEQKVPCLQHFVQLKLLLPKRT